MTTSMRLVFAGLSAFAIAMCIVGYVESLSGTTIALQSQWMTAIGFGAIVIQVPMYLRERASLKNRALAWKVFAQRVPKWAVFCVKLFYVVVFAHVVWLFIKSDYAVPTLQDGRYLLVSRGRIVRAITEKDYLALNAAEFRVFAVLMISCYLVPLLYWWFQRNQKQPD